MIALRLSCHETDAIHFREEGRRRHLDRHGLLYGWRHDLRTLTMRRLVEPGIPNARSVADALAANAAGYLLLTSFEYRNAATASVAEGFWAACIDHGIPIDAGDLAYYVKIVTAKVAEMSPRMVEELKGKAN
jgi:hypothetical protein